MSSDYGAIADHTNLPPTYPKARWRSHFSRQDQTHVGELGFYAHATSPSYDQCTKLTALMAAFHPLRTFLSSNIVTRTMVETSETVVAEEYVKKAGGLVLLLALGCAISYFEFSSVVTSDTDVKVEVVDFGMVPAGVAGDDLPILTVRLLDGSIRVVRATWADVSNCRPGRWISLVRKGTALQVGVPGCNTH